MNELEVAMVQTYIEEYLFEPTRTWPAKEFEERTYSRWAAYEIIERLMDSPFDPPDTIVELFIFELDYYSHISRNKKAARMFSIAREAAEDILCLLL